MLFHTWPFLLFMLVVLPVFFVLRRTPFWIPWLLAASYFFYGWWNPYYLLLIAYSTTLDYLLVTLMDRCPLPDQARAESPSGSPGPGGTQGVPSGCRHPITSSPPHPLTPSPSQDPILRAAFLGAMALALALIGGAAFGPAPLR